MFPPMGMNSGLSNLMALRNGPTFGSQPPLANQGLRGSAPMGGMWGGQPPVSGPYPVQPVGPMPTPAPHLPFNGGQMPTFGANPPQNIGLGGMNNLMALRSMYGM